MRPLYMIRCLRRTPQEHWIMPWVIYLNVGDTFKIVLGHYSTWRGAMDRIWALEMHRAMAMGPR